MFSNNPFAELSTLISPTIIEGYIILMFIMVVVGTILDMMHKKSAQYFFENAEKAKKNAKRTLGGGEKASLAVATVANEVLTSGEFQSTRRRLSHLLTMYGFIIFVATTVWLIFGYLPVSEGAAPAALTAFWHIGGIMLCLGGYWFWFFIRVDVASEGVKWYNFNGRGDHIHSWLDWHGYISHYYGHGHKAAGGLLNTSRPGTVYRCKHDFVLQCFLVQVCTHVFQASSGLPKTSASRQTVHMRTFLKLATYLIQNFKQDIRIFRNIWVTTPKTWV